MSKKTIEISGVQHTVEIVCGERRIDGMSFEKFIDTLSIEEKMDFAMLGVAVLTTDVSPSAALKSIQQTENLN